MCKDEFRKYQKVQCAFLFSRRRGKRSIYGCECCLDESLPKFKRTARRKARRALDIETKQEINEEMM